MLTVGLLAGEVPYRAVQTKAIVRKRATKGNVSPLRYCAHFRIEGVAAGTPLQVAVSRFGFDDRPAFHPQWQLRMVLGDRVKCLSESQRPDVFVVPSSGCPCDVELRINKNGQYAVHFLAFGHATTTWTITVLHYHQKSVTLAQTPAPFQRISAGVLSAHPSPALVDGGVPMDTAIALAEGGTPVAVSAPNSSSAIMQLPSAASATATTATAESPALVAADESGNGGKVSRHKRQTSMSSELSYKSGYTSVSGLDEDDNDDGMDAVDDEDDDDDDDYDEGSNNRDSDYTASSRRGAPHARALSHAQQHPRMRVMSEYDAPVRGDTAHGVQRAAKRVLASPASLSSSDDSSSSTGSWSSPVTSDCKRAVVAQVPQPLHLQVPAWAAPLGAASAFGAVPHTPSLGGWCTVPLPRPVLLDSADFLPSGPGADFQMYTLGSMGGVDMALDVDASTAAAQGGVPMDVDVGTVFGMALDDSSSGFERLHGCLGDEAAAAAALLQSGSMTDSMLFD